MSFSQHPLSAAFPAMSAEELQSLTDDIEVNGQREPIVTFEGMVIDGWHRYQACVALHLPPECRVLGSFEDPVAYVKSRNLHRRHLTGSQRAAAVVACSGWVPSTIGRAAPGAALTTAQLAKEADVGERTIRQAKAAHSAGLGGAVTDGTVTAKRAAEVSKLPELDRAAAIKTPSPKTPKTPAQAEAEQRQEDAHGGTDILGELSDENKLLQAEVTALKAEDKAAELSKWIRMHDAAKREQSKYMELLHQAKQREAWNAKQLARCGKAVGESDPDKIAPSVEAFARKHMVRAA
jgi:hypothetical protein